MTLCALAVLAGVGGADARFADQAGVDRLQPVQRRCLSTVRVDKSLRLRGGAAILLGLINPLAALLPLVDPADEKAGEFAQLLARGAGAAAK